MFALEAERAVMVVNPFHIGLGVVGKLERFSNADALAPPVIVAEIDRSAGFAGDEVIAALPVAGGPPGAFRSDGQMEFRHFLHDIDEFWKGNGSQYDDEAFVSMENDVR